MKVRGQLVPQGEDAADYIERLQDGQVIRAEVKRMRNYKFHKKFYALLDFAYDQWEPDSSLEYAGQPVQKNRKRFRKDIIILAGHYDSTVNLKGEVRLEAHSISFANMSEEDFEKLYSEAINVILTRILRNYTRADLEAVVAELLRFA